MSYSFETTLKIPKPVTAVSFASGSSGKLSVGSDDGSVRLYDLPATTVIRAIRGLGTKDASEVSSLQWQSSSGEGLGSLWVACGRKAFSYDLDAEVSKLVLASGDASSSLTFGSGDEDELNELHVHSSGRYLAFGTDEGNVGVLDVKSTQTTLMKTRHTNICSVVRFMPDRPNELVSGGYDSALLHFDFKQGALLSRFDIAAAPPESGSMAMPFIISLAMSPTGIVVATLADGRVWIGAGGAKLPGTKQKAKRSRKWEGLRDSPACYKQIATGPIVASAFTADDVLLTCTLLGKLAQHKIANDGDAVSVETIWTGEVRSLEKVSTLAATGKWLAIGGFGKDEKGLVEVWTSSGADAVEALAEQAQNLSISSEQK